MRSNPRRSQSGYMLLLVLVVLVAMMVSGIAMVRSMDTGQLVAGNMAARNGTINSADLGIQQAVAFIQLHASDGVLNADVPASGYYSNGDDRAWTDSSFWAACATCTSVDAARNTVSWAISRMCMIAGNPSGTGNYCASLNGSASNGGSYSSDAFNFNGSPKYVYRITVQVINPRNSSSISQAFVTL